MKHEQNWYMKFWAKLLKGSNVPVHSSSFHAGWNKDESESEVTQLCPTLCDPMDCSLPGSSIHEISQAKILEWVAISFSRRSFQLRDWTWVSHIVGRCLPFEPPGKSRNKEIVTLRITNLVNAFCRWYWRNKKKKT